MYVHTADAFKIAVQMQKPLRSYLIFGPALSLANVGGNNPLHFLSQVRVLAELEREGEWGENMCIWGK